MNDDLIEALVSFSNDPLGFALWAFPWGEAGTHLENHKLEDWHVEYLTSIRDGLSPERALREATVSGNGVGKSAMACITILWATCTFPDSRVVVTANTDTQLKTRTWAELGNWFHMFIAKDLFQLTATALFSRDPDRDRTWRCDAIPWSQQNVVAFQGFHNRGKRLTVIFDEASGIPDQIWEAIDAGSMTDADTQRLFCVFGNPNSPTGRFRECFPGGRYAHRWVSRKVDSRTVSFTDKAESEELIKAEGLDSDIVRIRVLGEFPRIGFSGFIGPDLASGAAAREPEAHLHDPLVIGVDVARFGDDASCIFIRKGRDGRTHAPIVLRGVDTMQLAGRVAELHLSLRPDAIFVDGGGVGGGVVDRLRQLRVPVIEVQFGAKADRVDPDEPNTRYANKRAEMWGNMRSWLRGGAIPTNIGLETELTGPNYGFNNAQEIQLERKQDMRRRGIASPDIADALALTFAYPVIPSESAGRLGRGKEPQIVSDYDPFKYAEVA